MSETSQPAFDLSGKVALVTGASRGIGAAIATCYARAGARVAVTARSLESLQDITTAIEADGGQALPLAAHSGDRDAVNQALIEVEKAFGGIDILVNNAATNPHFGPVLDADETLWDKILDVNVKGYARWVRASVPSMRQRGGGKVINVASILGLAPGEGMGLYAISKAAVLMLTKALATELADDDIQVNALAPGFIKTRFSAALWADEARSAALNSRIPQGRVGEAGELTGMALYLAAPASSFTTGSVFVIDGGHCAGSLNIGG